MTLSRSLIISILFTALPLLSSAQSLWRKAIIVKHDGTRLEGLINDREWTSNPTQVEFKEEGAEAQVFKVDDILEFSTDRGIKYRSADVKYDADKQTTINIPAFKESTNIVTDKVFLMVIVDADISLLYYYDKNDRAHYFMEKDGSITELVNRLYGPRANAMRNSFYKQQIALITNDCPEVQKTVKSIQYKQADLERSFLNINKCKGSEVRVLWPYEVTKKMPAFGVLIGGVMTDQEFLFSTTNERLVTPMGKISPGFGFFGEFFSKARPNKLSTYHEVTLKQIKQSGQHFNGHINEVYSVMYETTRLKMTNSVRWSYLTRANRRFYWGAGLITGFRRGTRTTPRFYYSGKEYKKFRNEFEPGVMAATGKTFTVKKFAFNLEARYEYEQSISRHSPLKGSHSIGVNLQFMLTR
jgi:hypothetical protein